MAPRRDVPGVRHLTDRRFGFVINRPPWAGAFRASLLSPQITNLSGRLGGRTFYQAPESCLIPGLYTPAPLMERSALRLQFSRRPWVRWPKHHNQVKIGGTAGCPNRSIEDGEIKEKSPWRSTN
jgi:hypothetical protein